VVKADGGKVHLFQIDFEVKCKGKPARSFYGSLAMPATTADEAKVVFQGLMDRAPGLILPAATDKNGQRVASIPVLVPLLERAVVVVKACAKLRSA
jgi:hypothetical protein